MSVDLRGLRVTGQRLRDLKRDVPEIMEQLAIGEGVYAVKQAKRICKTEGIVNTGAYRMNFHAGNKAMIFDGDDDHDGGRPRRSGKAFLIDVYNNLDYAGPLEFGFRSHFVPGHWSGHVFVYQPNDPAGGMYVGPYGGFVRGRFVLRRAIHRTKTTQDARLRRKAEKIIRDRLK